MLDYLDIGAQRLHESGTRSLLRVAGLIGPTSMRGVLYDRPEDDGVVEPLAQFKGARIIILEGECWGASIAAAWSEFDLLAAELDGAVSADKTLKWRRAGGVVDLQGAVRLAGDVQPVLEEGNPKIAYQATVRAADPIWYSQTEQSTSVGQPTAEGGMPLPIIFPIPFGAGVSGGAASVTNAGNVPTWPRITVQGPIVGPVVYNLERDEQLYCDSLSLAAGQALVIECAPRMRSASVAGTSAMGSIRWADSEFPAISAAATETIGFYGIGGGYGAGTALTVAWRAGYLT